MPVTGFIPDLDMMTSKQYITKSLNGLNVTEDDIDIILLKSGIEAESDADIEACDMAVHRRFTVVLKGMTQNVSEGGYSVSWNMEAVKMYYNALCCEYGLDNVLNARPAIRDRSNMW